MFPSILNSCRTRILFFQAPFTFAKTNKFSLNARYFVSYYDWDRNTKKQPVCHYKPLTIKSLYWLLQRERVSTGSPRYTVSKLTRRRKRGNTKFRVVKLRKNPVRKTLQQKKNLFLQTSKALEKSYLKKGLISESFKSPEARLEWYWKTKAEAALKSLEKQNICNGIKKVKMNSMRQFIKKRSPSTNVAGLSRPQLIEVYVQLKKVQLEKNRLKREEEMRRKLEAQGKLPDGFSGWLEKKNEANLTKGRRAAERHFKKGEIKFNPKFASDRLILLWYRNYKNSK